MAESKEQKLHDLLTDFKRAMLVTRTREGELRGRPMAVAQVEPDDTLWFVTRIQSGKVEDVLGEPHVSVTLQDDRRFVSITGEAEVVRDRQKLDQVWDESWKVWFPKGKEDPEIGLLKVRVHRGEFWDDAGGNRLKYLYEAAKAYVTGTTPDAVKDMKDMHGKVTPNGHATPR